MYQMFELMSQRNKYFVLFRSLFDNKRTTGSDNEQLTISIILLIFNHLLLLAQELTIIKRKRSAKKIKIICHFFSK